MCKFENVKKPLGKPKKNKTTKEVNAKTIKNHWENRTNTKNKFWTYDPLRRHRSKSFVVFCLLSQWFLMVSALTSLVVLFFFGFPNGF